MTPAQTAKYFAEFGKLRDVLRARGKSNIAIEQERHALTQRALGFAKSSKAFTNADLDKVLAVISAQLKPANFDAQMALQDMPEKRFCMLLHRVDFLSWHIGIEQHAASAYVDKIARNMFGCQYHDCTERQLQKIEGILRARLRQLNVIERVHQLEREAQAHADRMLGVVAPEIDRQASTKVALAAIVHSDDEPLF